MSRTRDPHQSASRSASTACSDSCDVMILLDGNSLTLDELVAIAREQRAGRARRVRAHASSRRSASSIERPTATRRLRHQHRLRHLRRRPHPARLARARCRSTCCAATPPASASRCRSPAVRATMALRANVLAKGFSGIRVETLDALHRAAQRRRASARAAPRIGRRERRSGAAGPPGARAHRRRRGTESADGTASLAREALDGAGLRRSRSSPKEGLALINGTQPSTAVAGAGRCSAPSGSRAPPISPRRCRSTGSRARPSRSIRAFTRARPFAGQRTSAANICGCWPAAPSTRRTPTAGACRTRTPCAAPPQVHGAARDALRVRARHVSTIEANAATDNPMVFADDGDIVSGGNFHGAPVALARRPARDRPRAAGDDQRAAQRSAGQSGAQRPARRSSRATADCSRG